MSHDPDAALNLLRESLARGHWRVACRRYLMLQAINASLPQLACLGLHAGAGTPQTVNDKVSQDLQKVLGIPDVQQQLLAQGALAQAGSPATSPGGSPWNCASTRRIITENNLFAD
jgi:hypothetical protein